MEEFEESIHSEATQLSRKMSNPTFVGCIMMHLLENQGAAAGVAVLCVPGEASRQPADQSGSISIQEVEGDEPIRRIPMWNMWNM